jgi:hypothetical protein
MMTDSAITFAVTLPSLLVLHSVADHWVQTNGQAVTKGKPVRDENGARDRSGPLANLRHVATLTATLAAGLAVLAWRFGLDYEPVRVAAGLTVNAVSHYWADRRRTLRNLAVAIGKRGWVDNDPNALYLLDQSWHMGWLFVAALVMV